MMVLVYGLVIFFILGVSVFLSSCIFWILLNREISFGKAVQRVTVAAALNKMLLTGSGYAAVSASLKNDSIPFYKSLASFAVLELFSVLPWIAAGFYFGAKQIAHIPFLLIVFFALVFFFVVSKKKRLVDFIKNAAGYFQETRRNILAVVPFVLLNGIAGLCYYSLFFKMFGLRIPWLEVFKLIAISFTLGYLSPVPAGLGVKESGMTFLLMQQGVSLKQAVSLAVCDRLLVTVFYGASGFLCGWGLLHGAIKAKFHKKK
ncbi:MAG: lysylphosphatidylglycerol synthase domain-containing protein [Candidatus Omnitrophota bacterium]|jgi:uncharacterized membrane protein YbhN (UPF0104 family)